MNFEHLKASAEESFANARHLRDTKPEAGMAAAADGHEALAAYYFANDDSRAWAEVRELLVSELQRYESFGTKFRTFPQHRYLLFALAIDDLTLARTIATLPIDRQNWSPMDTYLTYNFCVLLGVPQTVVEPRFEPTKAEEGIVTALEALKHGQLLPTALVESFWKATRRKRYQYTLLEHCNLLLLAFRALGSGAVV